ncbi:MAG TPA: UbiA family prenyltransferase [Pirellulales bacterium]|jgi:4-hydroxybenzoate polyprenyltransferase|nr:UbiA family prenyltransferase [Pirellulales bacterium]
MTDTQPAPSPAAGRSGTLGAYVELLRLPAVFTAMADLAMGFLLTHGDLEPWPVFAALWLSSSLLYLAGMVLNDVFDAELDARERPRRPIPSGRISRASAARLGIGLLLLGIVAGWVASGLVGRFESGAIATVLAALILLYDGVLKPTPFAPVAMGGCRTLNVLLGMSAAAASLPQLEPNTAGWNATWLVAGGIGVYIAGVTWFARGEADTSHRGHLLAGTLVMLAGIGLVAWYPAWVEPRLGFPQQLILIWLLIAAMVAIRCGWAILDPRAGIVQLAVRNCLLSLILIDAAAVLAVDGRFWACVVLSLVVPAMFLGRWISST